MHHFHEPIRMVYHLDHKMYFQEEVLVQRDIESESHLVDSHRMFHHRSLLSEAVVQRLQRMDSLAEFL
jgi:hypothetical protein